MTQHVQIFSWLFPRFSFALQLWLLGPLKGFLALPGPRIHVLTAIEAVPCSGPGWREQILMWMEPGSLLPATSFPHLSLSFLCKCESVCFASTHHGFSWDFLREIGSCDFFHFTSPSTSQSLAKLFSPAPKECWPPLLQGAQWGSASLPAALILIQVMRALRTSQEDILQTSNCYCLFGTLKKVSRAPRLPGGHFQTPNLLWLEGRWHV